MQIEIQFTCRECGADAIGLFGMSEPLRVIGLNGTVDHYVKEELPGGVVSTLCGAFLRGNPPQQAKPIFRTCRGCVQALAVRS